MAATTTTTAKPTASDDEIKALYGSVGRSTIDQGGYDYWKNSGLIGTQLTDAFKSAAGTTTAQSNAAGWDQGYAKQNPTVTADKSVWKQTDTNAFMNPTYGTMADTVAARSGMSSKDFMEGQNIHYGGTEKLFNTNGTNTWQYNADGTPKTDATYSNGYDNNNTLRDVGGFKYGLNQAAINDIYTKAGLVTPSSGHYGGNNNGTWMPDSGANDTVEAKQARMKALVAAGVSETDAWSMADNGYWTATSPEEAAANAAGGGRSGTSGAGGGLERYNPLLQGVDPNGLVENRMAGLLNSNSPYMQAARLRAMQEGNSSGLLNTSMAASAGEKAATEAALPIAQADAATYSNQHLTNQAAANTGGQFNANWSNDMVKMQQQQANAMESAQFDATTRQKLQDSMNTFTAGQNVAQRSASLQLAKINNSATATESNTRYAQDIYSKLNAMPAEAAKYMNDISVATGVSVEAKQAMISEYITGMNQQQTAYREQLQAMSFSPGTYFTFGSASGGSTSSGGSTQTGAGGQPVNFNSAGQTETAGGSSSPPSGLLGSSSSSMQQTAPRVGTGDFMYELGNAANDVNGLYDKAGWARDALPGSTAARAVAGTINAINNFTPGQNNPYSPNSDLPAATNYQTDAGVGPGSNDQRSTDSDW